MIQLSPFAVSITAEETAAVSVDMVFGHHDMPATWFTASFWSRLFVLLGTRLLMSTSDHPETNGQTERVNRVLEDVLHSDASFFSSWRGFLSMIEFALKNAVHASTELTTFYMNNARHPRAPVIHGLTDTSPLVGVETLDDLVSSKPRDSVYAARTRASSQREVTLPGLTGVSQRPTPPLNAE